MIFLDTIHSSPFTFQVPDQFDSIPPLLSHLMLFEQHLIPLSYPRRILLYVLMGLLTFGALVRLGEVYVITTFHGHTGIGCPTTSSISPLTWLLWDGVIGLYIVILFRFMTEIRDQERSMTESPELRFLFLLVVAGWGFALCWGSVGLIVVFNHMPTVCNPPLLLHSFQFFVLFDVVWNSILTVTLLMCVE